MKIQYIQISNVLSFKHYADFSECPKIMFDTKNRKDLHILIGPNGAGKSNLLEVITQIFTKGIFRLFLKNENSNMNNTISEASEHILPKLHLEPNRHAELIKNNQTVKIQLSLNDDDRQNIKFVLEKFEMIKSLAQEYSHLQSKIIYPTDANNQPIDLAQLISELNKVNSICLSFTREPNTPFKTDIDADHPLLKDFLKAYFENFDLLQKIIEINNEHAKQGTSEHWPQLKNTFYLINSFRNYKQIYTTYNSNEKKQKKQENIEAQRFMSTRDYRDVDISRPFLNALTQWCDEYEKFDLEEDMAPNQKFAIIERQPLFINIQNALKGFLGLELKLRQPQKSNRYQMELCFLKGNEEYSFSYLSVGQKAILLLIFSLYSTEIEHGFLLIDEPELHLHPQFQAKYLEILLELGVKRDIQIMLVTHSPSFVNEQTIKNVKRVYFDDQDRTTRLISNKDDIDTKIIQYLHYTNNAKIFFANKVILVEGPADEYFFNFYINEVYAKEHKVSDFEILNIGGKTAYETWKSFLEKWNIQIAYICDWDNVKEFDLITEDEMKKFKAEYHEEAIRNAVKNLREKESNDGKSFLSTLDQAITAVQDKKNKVRDLESFYEELLQKHTPWSKILKAIEIDRKSAIDIKIEEIYSKNIYILKKGELEDYLKEVKGKRLEDIIDWCHTYQDHPLQDECKKEINAILDKIFETNRDGASKND